MPEPPSSSPPSATSSNAGSEIALAIPLQRALSVDQSARIAFGFARRNGWTAFWSPSNASAYLGAVVVALPVRYVESKRWTEHTASDIQFLSGAEALSMPQTELPAPPPYSNAIHTTIAHLGESGQCPVCAGSGKTSCSRCAGRGRTACPRCSKAPAYMPTCSACRGYSFANNPCQSCNGSGKEVPCRECKGERMTTCLSCTGLGNGDCARCRGTGKAFKSRLLTKTYETRRSIEWTPALPAEVTNWLEGALPLRQEEPLDLEEESPNRVLAARKALYSGEFHLGHYKRNLHAFFLEYNGAYMKINEQLARKIARAYGAV